MRLVHPPSGTTIVVNEHRSQHQNRELAFARLAEKLEELNRPEVPRRPTRVPRGVKEARLRNKKRRAETKASRSKRFDD